MGYLDDFNIPDTRERLFVGFAIPNKVKSVITKQLKRYPHNFIQSYAPKDDWHITVLFLGTVKNHRQYISRLQKPLLQSFVPALSITHLGRGLRRNQLWAYIDRTQALRDLKKDLTDRLVLGLRIPLEKDDLQQAYHRLEFAPHIHVANSYPMLRGMGMPDQTFTTTFVPKEMLIYRSVDGAAYSVEGTIPITA